MSFHGGRAEVQSPGDLGRRLPFGDEHEDLLLAWAELGAIVARPQADLLGDAGLGRAIEDGLAARHRRDRPPDRRRLGVLGEVAGRPERDRFVRVDGRDLGGKEEQPRGPGLPLGWQRLDHLRLHDRHVRREPPDRCGQLGDVVRLGDELELPVLADRSGERVAEERARIRRDHADRAISAVGARRGRGAGAGHPCTRCLRQQGTSLERSAQVSPWTDRGPRPHRPSSSDRLIGRHAATPSGTTTRDQAPARPAGARLPGRRPARARRRPLPR